MSRKLSVHRTSWPLSSPFRITGYVFENTEAVVVEIREGGFVGRGEGVGVYYLGETVDSMLDQIEAVRVEIERGVELEALQQLLPPGGARNAVDCALWDLKANASKKSIWALTGIEPHSIRTVYTISIQETPALMAEKAANAKKYPLLKIKLDGEMPIERISTIRAARPDATLVVDANQGFTLTQLIDVAKPLADLGVAMIEQPLPRGGDDGLEQIEVPIPICADESCLHREDLPAALARYDMINIKLDKTGGLTEALALAREVHAAGKRLMIGNMIGTSLSMAPAFVIAQMCEFIDLDGPLNLKSDYVNGLRYEGPTVFAPDPGFWGGML